MSASGSRGVRAPSFFCPLLKGRQDNAPRGSSELHLGRAHSSQFTCARQNTLGSPGAWAPSENGCFGREEIISDND